VRTVAAVRDVDRFLQPASNSRRLTSPVSASCVAWYDIWRAMPRISVTSCNSTTAPMVSAVLP